MPNLTFLTLHFFHMMALVLWVGGMFAIGTIVAPVAFRESRDRRAAGRIVGKALRRFDVVVIGCIVSLAVTSFLMAQWYGRWSPWYAIQYTCIGLMSASALLSMSFLGPRLQRLRSARDAGSPDADPQLFGRLHRAASMSMQFNLACGTVAILFS